MRYPATSLPAATGARPSAALSCAAFTLLLSFWPATTVAQQSGNANERLKQLNVRLETEHYVLAGTVNDRILEQCGQQLEAIYHDYALLFDQVLRDEEKSPDKAKQTTNKPTGGKGGATSQGAQPKTGPADPDAKPTAQEGQSSSAPASQPTAKPATSDSGKKGKTPGSAKPGKTKKGAAEGQPAQSIDQDDPRGRLRVLIFGTQGDYDQFLQEFRLGTSGSSRGMYVPSLRLLLIADQGNPEDTGGVIFHEACHQFVGRHIQSAPTWLNEGLATYYGSARTARGGLKLEPDRDRWQLCRKAITADRAISLNELMGATHKQFHESAPLKISGYRKLTREGLFYAQSYTLMHLLLSHPEGRERLRGYIRALAKAPPSEHEAATRKSFGPDARAALERNWREYIVAHPENE